jgi:hypothetical protein
MCHSESIQSRPPVSALAVPNIKDIILNYQYNVSLRGNAEHYIWQ